MASSNSPALRDIAILSRAVENVLRKLIRILIGRMSLKKLQEMIQIIFIEEAEAKLRRESPGKSVALGDVALITSVDTRTIKRIRSQIAMSDLLLADTTFLDGFMPLFKVFDLWLNNPQFFDKNTGKPRVLKIEGDECSFSQLVKMSIQSRGLSTQGILKRLKEIEIVEEDPEKGTVRLLQEDNVFISKDDLDLLEVGLTAIGNLINTVGHNIHHKLDKEEKFFQRGSWNYQLSPDDIGSIRKIIHRFLRKTDIKSRELITSLENPERGKGQITAGISMFYFEEEMPG